MWLKADTRIRLKHLKQSTWADKNGEYAVVAWDTDISIKVSEDLLAVLKQFSEGKTVGEVARTAGVTVADLEPIVEELSEGGFISSIDGVHVPNKHPKIKPLLVHAPRQIFQFFLSRTLLVIGLAVIVSGLFIGIFLLGYTPKIAHYFWHPDIFVVYITGFAAEIVLLFIHEAAHFVATKGLGGEATMRISRRAINIVAETESYHLSVIPKELRYYVYFSGMYVDFLIMAVIFWIVYAFRWWGIEIGLYQTFAYSLVLVLITGIVWQYNAYLETDMYNFLSDIFDEENLRANTRKYLARFVSLWPAFLQPIKRLITKILMDKNTHNEAEDLRQFTKREKRLFLLYGLFFVSGMVGLISTFTLIDIPKKIIAVYKTIVSISVALGADNIPLAIRQSLLLILMSYQYIIHLVLNKKAKKNR